jgi:predicted MPP superfamily phosphohydrolase
MLLSRRTLVTTAVQSVVGASVGGFAYGESYERYQLGLTHTELPVSGLDRALDGVRIAFLTDLHHSLAVPASLIRRAVTMTSAATPDLVVLGGDFVSFGDRAFVEPVAELLGPLSAPHGVFAVLGNHDEERPTTAALTRRGIVVLNDRWTRLTVKGAALDLAGVRFWTRRRDVVAALRGIGPSAVLLAHDPRRIEEAAQLDVGGVLSGHTHGGQIVLPGLGAIAARRFPVAAGRIRRDDTWLFVSRGIGTTYVPVRLGCPPEVALVTLRRQANY